MNKFVKMDKSLLNEKDDQWVFQEFAAHVEDLVGETYYITTNVEKLENAPKCAKNILYVWHFFCEVNSAASIYDYIYYLNLSDAHLLNCLNAIQKIGFKNMAERYEAGLKLALEDKNFIEDSHLSENFPSLTNHDKYINFNNIDDNIYELSSKELPKYATKYIREHKDKLFS